MTPRHHHLLLLPLWSDLSPSFSNYGWFFIIFFKRHYQRAVPHLLSQSCRAEKRQIDCLVMCRSFWPKVPLRHHLPPCAYLILSLEEHQVTMDGREVTMVTTGLSPLRLLPVLTAIQSSEWEHETKFPPSASHLPFGGFCRKNKRILLKVQFKLIQSVFNKLHRYHGHVYVKGSHTQRRLSL